MGYTSLFHFSYIEGRGRGQGCRGAIHSGEIKLDNCIHVAVHHLLLFQETTFSYFLHRHE